MLLNVYVVKSCEDGKVELHDLQIGPRGCERWPTFVVFNETGNVRTAEFKLIMGKLAEVWKLRHNELLAYLFLDGLSVHEQLVCYAEFIKAHLRPVFLYENTTHLSQPLDQHVFALLKTGVYVKKREMFINMMLNADIGAITSMDHAQLADVAAVTAFKPNVIQRSFKDTGIFPWTPAIIIQLAIDNNGHKMESPSEQAKRQHIDKKIFELVDTDRRRAQKVAGRRTIRAQTKHLYSFDRVLMSDDLKKKKEQQKAAAKQRGDQRTQHAANNYRQLVESRLSEFGGERPAPEDGFWDTHCRRCCCKWVNRGEWMICEADNCKYAMCKKCWSKREGRTTMTNHEKSHAPAITE